MTKLEELYMQQDEVWTDMENINAEIARLKSELNKKANHYSALEQLVDNELGLEKQNVV